MEKFLEMTNAPVEVREATAKAAHAFKRYQHAKKQSALWGNEQELAAKEHAAAQERQTDILNRWNPTTGEIVQLEAAPALAGVATGTA